MIISSIIDLKKIPRTNKESEVIYLSSAIKSLGQKFHWTNRPKDRQTNLDVSDPCQITKTVQENSYLKLIEAFESLKLYSEQVVKDFNQLLTHIKDDKLLYVV